MSFRSIRLVSLAAVAALALAACGSDDPAPAPAPATDASTSAAAGTDAPGSALPGTDTPEFAALAERGVLRVGTEGTYAPFSFHGDGGTGPLTGYDVEVITAVAAELGLSVEFSETQWDTIFAGLEAGRYDVVANQVTVNEERKQKYDLSVPYTYSYGVIVTKADNASVTGVADIAGKKAAQSTTSNWAQVVADAGGTVEGVEGFAQAVALVKQGRVDLTVNDSLAVLDYLNTTGDTEIKVAGQTEDTSEQALAFVKDSGLVQAFDAAIEALVADGTLNTISDKYFGQDVSDR